MMSKTEIAQRMGVNTKTLRAYCILAGFWENKDRRKLLTQSEAQKILLHFGEK